MTRRAHRAVDLDACTCVDVGHHWRHMEFTAKGGSRLRGAAHRLLWCMVCGTTQTVALTWDGRPMAGTRHYDSDEVYLANARMLGDTVSERRANYRRELIARSREAAPVTASA